MFSLRRFALLAEAEWVENRRAWAWFLGILVMVHFVLVLILRSGDTPWEAFTVDGQVPIFMAGLFITAPIFAARYFQALGRPGPELLALMRPASALEKWLLAVLVVGVAYPVAFHLAYLICDVPATWIAAGEVAREAARTGPPESQSTAWAREAIAANKYHVFHLFSGDIPLRAWVGVGLMITTLQAFAVAGSLVFRRWPFLKTLLAGFLVLLASILAVAMFKSGPEALMSYWEDPANYRSPAPLLVPIAWYTVPVMLWLAALLALREREVAG